MSKEGDFNGGIALSAVGPVAFAVRDSGVSKVLADDASLG